jgi:glycosyltransferase involved in cell wall biosynthesis
MAAVENAPPVEKRTAIVHDWFQGYHGSERVVDAMRTSLFAPGNRPDIFTFHAARELLPQGLADAIVKESRLAGLPGIRQRGHHPGRWRYFLPYMPTYFSRLPLDDYELVISSSHACAVNVRPPPDAIHVCYCYTPIRYAWMPETEAGRASGMKGVALGMMAKRLRRIDLQASRGPQAYIAISNAVRERIKRFYGRESVVIHPPVDVDDFDHRAEKEAGRFLWVHRLVGYKRPELVVEAFRHLPYRLTMVGVGPLESKLRANLPSNVELVRWLPRDELARLYARSSGFVHVGEEDFGISMVEALASGTPVVAVNRGGAKDIVRNEIDGLLIERPDVDLLGDAVRRLAAARWDAETLRKQSETFSQDRFSQRFRRCMAELNASKASWRRKSSITACGNG